MRRLEVLVYYLIGIGTLAVAIGWLTKATKAGKINCKIEAIRQSADRWARQALENKLWRMLSGVEPTASDPFSAFAWDLKEAIATINLSKFPLVTDDIIDDIKHEICRYLVRVREDRSNRGCPPPYECGHHESDNQPSQWMPFWTRGFVYSYSETKFVRKLLAWHEFGLGAVVNDPGPMPELKGLPKDKYSPALTQYLTMTSGTLGQTIEAAQQALDRLRPFTDDAEVAMLVTRYENLIKAVSTRTTNTPALDQATTEADQLLRRLEARNAIGQVREKFSNLASTIAAQEEVQQISLNLK